MLERISRHKFERKFLQNLGGVMKSTLDSTLVHLTNFELATKLDTVSELLSMQGADRFRVEAYQRAASSIRELDRLVWQIYGELGIDGLEKIPGVGRTISRALQQLIRGGRWPLLERLQGNDVAEQAFASVPGLGPKLAKRIHEELGIETLAELQIAAWNGRLGHMQGIGKKRVQAVRESLAARGRQLSGGVGQGTNEQSRLFADSGDLTSEVSVAELLDIDDQYRFQARKGQLPRTTPKRFNPTQAAWLPVLHTQRNGRHYTALFSNSAHAHAMGTTHDWVVIYFEDHEKRGQHGRWTVITSGFGKLKGRRIVRGREKECESFYADRREKTGYRTY